MLGFQGSQIQPMGFEESPVIFLVVLSYTWYPLVAFLPLLCAVEPLHAALLSFLNFVLCVYVYVCVCNFDFTLSLLRLILRQKLKKPEYLRFSPQSTGTGRHIMLGILLNAQNHNICL